jgi:hypothetical protein
MKGVFLTLLTVNFDIEDAADAGPPDVEPFARGNGIDVKTGQTGRPRQVGRKLSWTHALKT